MTSILERAVAIIAPHHCIVCSKQNNMLCEICASDLFGAAQSTCFACQTPTHDFSVCKKCRQKQPLEHVWFSSYYEGAVATLIKALKFERAKAAAIPLGNALAATLPALPEDYLIVPIPTAHQRVRQRGYDQSILLAKQLSRSTNLVMLPLLQRMVKSRQVGATKQQRAHQSTHAFWVTNTEKCRGASILLVDDVLTTGSTVIAAATALRQAGAMSVSAVVVARST